MTAIIALLFMIGAPIYAFLYPSFTSVFFAGMAAMLFIEVIAATVYKVKLRKAIRGLQALDKIMAKQTVNNDEATKH